MAKACGAKTRAGTPCKHAPMEGKKRCKLHGGASTGPSKGSRNAMKHGAYSRVILPGESGIASDLSGSLGTIENELLVVRLQLHRALAAQNAANQTGTGLELDSEKVRDQVDQGEHKGQGVGGVTYAGTERDYKRRDYNTIIDRLVGRIESLEKTRAELMKATGGEPPMPIGRIEIEVVGAKHKNDNDGAAS